MSELAWFIIAAVASSTFLLWLSYKFRQSTMSYRGRYLFQFFDLVIIHCAILYVPIIICGKVALSTRGHLSDFDFIVLLGIGVVLAALYWVFKDVPEQLAELNYIICPHCLKNIKTIRSWDCPYCSQNNNDQDIFAKCGHCRDSLRHFKCPECRNDIDFSIPYNLKDLRKKRDA